MRKMWFATALALALTVCPSALVLAQSSAAILPTLAQTAPAPDLSPAADAPAVSADAPPVSEATPVQQAAQRVAETLRGQSLLLGLGYVQNTGKFTAFKNLAAPGVSAQITDNGRIAPFIQYSSPEKEFASYHLQQGRVGFGYNLIATYEQFNLNRQLVDSPFVGKDLNTQIQGDYLAVAPLVFMRLGPLYPGREIYWKFGVGAGAALLRYHGDIIATKNGVSQLEDVSYYGDSPSLFETAVWELQVERWVLLFKALYVAGGGTHESFSVEQYGLTLAYRFDF